jgi:iron complex outermembrane receptor protein
MNTAAFLTFALSISAPDAGQPQVRVPVTTVTVIGQKELDELARLPLSGTNLPGSLLLDAGIQIPSDAARFSPNTQFTEFTARKLSNARIRGLGASPANPGVTTYVDGVPMLNSNTSSFDFIDVEQMQVLRGPQGTLYGRNAIGGVINIVSASPSLTQWSGQASVPLGSNSLFEARANANGPIVKDKLSAGFALAYARREGYTEDIVSGNDVDYREGLGLKGQLLWTPNSSFSTRLILSSESARDGYYALSDLALVEQFPFEVTRDYLGRTERDMFQTAVLSRYDAGRFSLTNVFGFLDWKTFDSTDLDYTFLPLATRDNLEDAAQITNEIRVFSPLDKPLNLGGSVGLRWQVGALFFNQDYDQNAIRTTAPFVLDPSVDFSVSNISPAAQLDDVGVGIYGQGTFAFGSRFEASVGARFDYERRDAFILTAFSPMIAPDIVVDESRTFSDVSPQFAAGWRVNDTFMIYGAWSRAFKAGGYNPVSIPGNEAFNEEHASNIEAGVKYKSNNDRYSASAAVFSIDWEDLQLNVPILFSAGSFYIDNVGDATSRGVEFEASFRPNAGWSFYSALGLTRARFSDGSTSGGLDVSGNEIPNTPAYTVGFGAQYTKTVRQHELWGRIDVGVTGAYQYDEANTAGQDAYTLTTIRGGMRMGFFTIEGWVRNAFDVRYAPLAFPFPGFTLSGFLAEPGAPRTWGVTAGVRF